MYILGGVRTFSVLLLVSVLCLGQTFSENIETFFENTVTFSVCPLVSVFSLRHPIHTHSHTYTMHTHTPYTHTLMPPDHC